MLKKEKLSKKVKKTESANNRMNLIDSLRGITIISMVLFHGSWDMVYLFAHDWPWYLSKGAYVWQQSICWTFILISGFCFYFSKRHYKRGLTVFIAGIIISAATLIFMPPGNGIIFGILTFMGSAMLIFAVLDKYLRGVKEEIGICISVLLFFIFRNINIGYLGFEGIRFCKLPEQLFKGYFMTYLGFRDMTFYSTDYFSIIPWIFLFMTGYYLCPIVFKLCKKQLESKKGLLYFNVPGLSFIGRHSLIIYMLHQPIIYVVLMALHGGF